MSLYDGYTEEKNDDESRKKLKKVILMCIIIVTMLIFVLIGLIMYTSGQPKELRITLNGEESKDLLELLDIQVDEEGNMEIYAPIKSVAKYFEYDDSNGNYMVTSEDTNSCNVKNSNEVAIFTLDSDIIYKKDLTNPKSNYETYKLSEEVFKKDEELYTNYEGLQLGFNVTIGYDSKTNTLMINTLDQYILEYTTPGNEGTTIIQDMGYTTLDEAFVNRKAILDGMLVVKNETGEYGVVTLEGQKKFSTQYEALTYIPESEAFLIQSNKKVGIISVAGETKIKPVYDSLQLIDNQRQLYLVSENNKYGVINGEGNGVIHLDYDKIGIDIAQFSQNNLTTGYIIQDALIPVQQDLKWGFYNLEGELVGEGIVYENVGCITTSSIGTAYPVLSIPEYKSIVVSKAKKYGCINLEGETTVSFIADDVYMQISSGETKYFMTQKRSEQIYSKDIEELLK